MAPSSRLNLPSAPAKQQTEGRFLWNEARSPLGADFFTIGYTGRPIDELLDVLVANGIRTLVDIRYNPVSMYRPELNKRRLQQLLRSQRLHYVHAPELGVPRDVRAKAVEAGSREAIWTWYDEHVVATYLGRNLHWFLNSLEHPVALMCVEIDPGECHRHRLFVALEERGFRGFDL